MSGDCTELTLHFLFSGVFVGDSFLLKPVLTVVSSLQKSFFLGESILILHVLILRPHFLGDIDGLLVFCGTKIVCNNFAGDEELDLAGEKLGVLVIIFDLDGEELGVLKPTLLAGEVFGVTFVFESMNCFSMLSNSPHSISSGSLGST